MKSLWMLPLLILLALVTCARIALAAPDDPLVVFCDETDVYNPDAISGADEAYQLVDYKPSKEMRELGEAIDAAEAQSKRWAEAQDRYEAAVDDYVGKADHALTLASYQPKAGDGLLNPFEGDAGPAPAPVPAATTPDPTDDPGAYAQAVMEAAKGAKWMLLFGLLLVALIAGVRWALEKKWSWFGTDRGKAVATMGVTFVGVVSSSMIAGIFDWTIILPAAATFLAGAVMLYVMPKKISSQS